MYVQEGEVQGFKKPLDWWTETNDVSVGPVDGMTRLAQQFGKFSWYETMHFKKVIYHIFGSASFIRFCVVSVFWIRQIYRNLARMFLNRPTPEKNASQ